MMPMIAAILLQRFHMDPTNSPGQKDPEPTTVMSQTSSGNYAKPHSMSSTKKSVETISSAADSRGDIVTAIANDSHVNIVFNRRSRC